MAGSIGSTNEDADRLFATLIGPSLCPSEWLLRVHPLAPWTDRQRAEWLGLIAEGFIRLAAVGGLCGERGSPTAMGFAGDVDVYDVDGAMEWQFGRLAVDPGAASLLLNLCDWGALHIAPAAAVEVLGHALPAGPEPQDRPLPRRTARLSFALDESGPAGEDAAIQAEFVREPNSAEAEQIRRLLRPWYNALLRWGFALPSLPTGSSEVLPADPPLLVVGELWCYRFERFVARHEAIEVFLNCLERIHHVVCPVRCVAIE